MRLKPVNVKFNAQRENRWFVNWLIKSRYASVRLISKNVQREKLWYAQPRSMRKQDLKQSSASVKKI